MERELKVNSPITITTIDNEPRVLDTDLGEALGFDRPRAIRHLIDRNLEELEGYGSLATQRGESRGQTFTAYYLNEQQATLVCMFARTERSAEVRRQVIRMFTA